MTRKTRPAWLVFFLLLGVAASLAAGCKKSGPSKGGGNTDPPNTDTPNNPNPDNPDPPNKDKRGPTPVVNPDTLVDISGPFPDTKPFVGITPKTDEILTIHLVAVGTSLKKEETIALAVLDYYKQKIADAVAPKAGRTAHRTDAPDGTAVLQTIKLAPVTEDPNAVAKRIDFGTVRRVDGRVITLVVRRENAVIPPDVLKAAPPTTAPNPRTIDGSKLVFDSGLIGDYQFKAKDAEARYTGQQILLFVPFPDMMRDADGKACLVAGADKGKNRPSVVVRLVNENGWKEGARMPKEAGYVEGRVVGAKPAEEFKWMRDWAKLPQAGIHVPGKVIVIEDAKVVTPP